MIFDLFNRFGNMMPPEKYMQRPYLMDRAPFRIAGNLYYVGNIWCSSHLIDTGDGLILLDTPCASGLAGLLDNIWRLGFDPQNLKYIVISHAHTDHYGAVRALAHKTGATTFMGVVDARDMREHPERTLKLDRDLGFYNERFQADVELADGDLIRLGNTCIRCVLTPGHTIGTMSHFWTLVHEGTPLRVGIYGGAGFVTISKQALEDSGLPQSLQETFKQSIDKVWSEEVDIMLGNHPFHNDTYQKHQRTVEEGENAFIDASEWRRFLTELRENYADFLKKTPVQIQAMYAQSQMLSYYSDPKSEI